MGPGGGTVSVMLRYMLLVAVAAWLAASAAAAARPDAAARLTVVDRAPLTVVGSRFPAGRSVVLRVVTPYSAVRRALTSGAGGRIQAAFPHVSLTGKLRCAVGVVIAARVEGGDVVLWSERLPDCPSPVRHPATSAVG